MTTDHEPIEPDVLVQTALRLLPVPDHEPDFWARLEAALDAEPAPSIAGRQAKVEEGQAASGEKPGHPRPGGPDADGPDAAGRGASRPMEVIELVPGPVPGVVPVAMRRTSNLVLSVLAVAAAIAVVVAGASLVRSRVDDDPFEDETAAEAEGDASTTAGEAATFSAPADEPAAAAVVAWIDAIAAGEMEAAWELLGPESQAYWGSFEAFAAERTGFAEGYGAWRVADPTFLVTPLEGTSEELVLVTLVGAVPQEGTTIHRADTFPVLLGGEVALLEPHGSAGVMEIVVPDDPAEDGTPASVGTDEELVLVVPEGVSAPVLRVDDGEPVVCGQPPGTELTDLEGTPARRCGYAPEGGLPSGEHVLVAAFTSPDGTSVTAHSVAFRVG
ncbi:MAG: hypothetical protein ACO1PW_10435 [Actinomycetota bacterium]